MCRLYYYSIRELSGHGRLFFYPHTLHGKSGKTGMEDTDIGDPMNYRAKLANASCRTARSGLAVSEKIILAGGSGIFPENLAFPEAFAARPP